MGLVRGIRIGLLCAALAGCGVSVAEINARPDKYYQHKVDFVGRVARRQDLDGETLLEVADPQGARILVHAKTPPEARTDDWIRVQGILVPEARVGTAILYDVVVAERITRRHAPRFANLT